jgi:hypothetical protein
MHGVAIPGPNQREEIINENRVTATSKSKPNRANNIKS